MVDTHFGEGFSYVPMDDVTHNMLMTIAQKAPQEFDTLDFYNDHISELLIANMKTYIDLLPIAVLTQIPVKFFDDANALMIIKRKPELIWKFSNRSNEFVKECVKVGSHFKNLSIEYVTLPVLNELVTARASVIVEIPPTYVSDDLYIICMKTHKYTLSQVPEEFRTTKLVSIALELYPEEGVLKTDDINDINDTDSKSVDSKNIELMEIKIIPELSKIPETKNANTIDMKVSNTIEPQIEHAVLVETTIDAPKPVDSKGLPLVELTEVVKSEVVKTEITAEDIF